MEFLVEEGADVSVKGAKCADIIEEMLIPLCTMSNVAQNS